MKRLNLKPKLDHWVKQFVRIMRQFMTQQKGVDLKPYEPLAEATLKDRKRRGITSTKRLIDTGALRRDSFESETTRTRLELGLSDSGHPRGKGASFDQIGAYNQRELTGRHRDPNWFGIPEKVMEDALEDIADEAERQMFDDPTWGSHKTVRVRA